MVWPNRGAIGAIGGYGLNVLNLLQGSHRCCRYAPARRFKKARKTIRQAQAPSPVFFVEAPSRPVVLVSCRPLPTEGARDARGPKGPTGLDASRHRGLSKRLLVPQVRQTQGVPRAVFEACSAPSPVVGRSSRSPEEPVRDSPPLKPGHSAGGHADWTTGPPAVRGLGVRDRHAGIMRGWTAGDRRHISDACRFPATAPRPASGDADQTPLGNGGGIPLGIHTLGI